MGLWYEMPTSTLCHQTGKDPEKIWSWLIGMKLGMLFTNVPVDNLMRQFDLGSLEVRRNHTDLFLSFKDVSTELLTAPICCIDQLQTS